MDRAGVCVTIDEFGVQEVDFHDPNHGEVGGIVLREEAIGRVFGATRREPGSPARKAPSPSLLPALRGTPAGGRAAPLRRQGRGAPRRAPAFRYSPASGETRSGALQP